MPTGIATDATTQYFFKDLVETASLSSLFDFENAKPLFEGVHRSYKFCLLTLTGTAVKEAAAEFAFFLHDPNELAKDDVRFELKPDEITLLNPNTGTCPIFRSRRDAEITLSIYRRVPVLIKQADPEGNPWDISFLTIFHMSNDSHLFHWRDALETEGWILNGNVFERENDRMLPLYEAKMIHHFDHRWATYDGDKIRDSTPTEKVDQNFSPLPRYWVAEKEVTSRLRGRWNHQWLMGWRRFARSTDERTFIANFLPAFGVGDSLFLALSNEAEAPCLWAGLTTFVFDYLARQKLSGTNMLFYIVEQLPLLPPVALRESCAWEETTVSSWIRPRIAELVTTASDLHEFADEVLGSETTFHWDMDRRLSLRVELDAAFFHLYDIDREDVDYIMDTFPIVKRKDEQKHGEYRTKRLILEVYDGMADAITTGEPYQTILDPPPGEGPRHQEGSQDGC